MRKLIIVAMLFASCSKSTNNVTVEPVPTEITVTTTLYPSASYVVQGSTRYWINIKTTYPIGVRTTLHASFNNPYYNNGKVNTSVPMPVFSKDTAVETNQPYSASGSVFSNYKVDSIKGNTQFILRY